MENLFKSEIEFPLFEMGVGVEFFGDVGGAVLCDFGASVAVENCKKEGVLIESEVEEGIFHVFSPAWVGGGVPCISMEKAISFLC